MEVGQKRKYPLQQPNQTTQCTVCYKHAAYNYIIIM